MLRTFRGILPTVDPSAYLDRSAQVIGDVHIGPESSVWMNVVIRGDVNTIRIGARTNVQDGTVVHVQAGTHPTAIGEFQVPPRSLVMGSRRRSSAASSRQRSGSSAALRTTTSRIDSTTLDPVRPWSNG